jgi:hypothetical protein
MTRRKTTSEFVRDAILVHGDKYDYSKVEYKNSKSKVIIICKTHGEFLQEPVVHIRQQNGCSKCSCNYIPTTEEWILKAKEIHSDKYDYSKVEYMHNKSKVIIICKTHGEFLQTPNNHLTGNGCSKCSGKYNYTTDEWINKVKKIHVDKYDYSKVDYKNSVSKIIIICRDHGEFLQTPSDHIQGYGCSKCAGCYNPTTEEWILKAKEIHSDKYDYSKVEYMRTKTKVIIICKVHGEFLQTPHNHLTGSGCSKCQLCPSCQLWRTWGKLCGYCLPKNKNKLYQKTKEYAVVKYLKDHLPDYDFIHNQSVGSDCTKSEKENSNGHLYPDIRYDCGHYHLIVEVDEHRHRGENYKCDKQRMYDIIAKLGLPCIFIRYNPDSQESNKEILLQKIKDYLELDVDSDGSELWNNYGFNAEYLFY